MRYTHQTFAELAAVVVNRDEGPRGQAMAVAGVAAVGGSKGQWQDQMSVGLVGERAQLEVGAACVRFCAVRGDDHLEAIAAAYNDGGVIKFEFSF